MADRPALASEPARLLALSRRDRSAAAKALAGLPLAEQVALVCSAPVSQRSELLDLVPEPELLIPLLPEAELCFTVKAIGLESATWLLDYATPEQVVTALDLDVWSGDLPMAGHLDAWLDALSETGDGALLRAVHAIDPELLVLYLKGRLYVEMKPSGDEGWEPPDGSQTIDGVFHFVPLRANDDAEAIVRTLSLLFQQDYWTYFRALQGVIWELDAENAEWAYRWRSGRLEDLGFPQWGEAMSLYTYLRPEELAALPPGGDVLEVSEWHLPVWIPSLPEGLDSRHLVFRAIAALSDEGRRAAFYAFVAVANKVAVADRMELSDVETTPRAVEKAARWMSLGLEHLCSESGLEADEVMRRIGLERLFCVGANLDPDAARPPPRFGSAEESDGTKERGPAGEPTGPLFSDID